jgi:hypothetical protein
LLFSAGAFCFRFYNEAPFDDSSNHHQYNAVLPLAKENKKEHFCFQITDKPRIFGCGVFFWMDSEKIQNFRLVKRYDADLA